MLGEVGLSFGITIASEHINTANHLRLNLCGQITAKKGQVRTKTRINPHFPSTRVVKQLDRRCA